MDERDHLRLALSDAMRAVLRPNDILCALGEDQWAVILPELLHSAQVSLAGSKLVDACEVLRSNNFPGSAGASMRVARGRPSTRTTRSA
jgi:GGDEF domain-containing protein